VAWCGKLADFPTVGKPVASGAAQIRAAALCHYYHTQNISYGRKNLGVDNLEKKWHTAGSVPSKNNYNATRATAHGHYYQPFLCRVLTKPKKYDMLHAACQLTKVFLQ
jgi:hypothetical protein